MSNFICKDCGAKIPPEYKGAISKNECPGCLGEIMSETQQQLIAELGEAMKQMPNDPIGVAGWLVSNFKLEKIGDCSPVEKFHDKSNKQEQPKPQEKDTSRLEAFFKRSGYDLNKVKQAEEAKRKAVNGEAEDYYPGDLEAEDEEMVEESSSNEIDEMLSNDGSSPSEIAKARAYLEMTRQRQLEARDNVANGTGATSRTGKPAGFWRT